MLQSTARLLPIVCQEKTLGRGLVSEEANETNGETEGQLAREICWWVQWQLSRVLDEAADILVSDRRKVCTTIAVGS